MNILIKAPLSKPLTVLDDRIIYGKKEIPFSSITRAKLTPMKNSNKLTRVITIDYDNGKWIMPVFNPQDTEHKKAIEYLLSCVDKTAAEMYRKEQGIKENGYKKRCNVCGKIICYTLEDIEENKRKARSAALSGLGGIAGALSGNYAAGATSNQTAADELDRIIDYTKCPSCGSRDLVDITDEDIAKINAQQNGQPAVSSADELKKFKELLDMGVITQEEFDQKKKQLLGL